MTATYAAGSGSVGVNQVTAERRTAHLRREFGQECRGIVKPGFQRHRIPAATHRAVRIPSARSDFASLNHPLWERGLTASSVLKVSAAAAWLPGGKHLTKAVERWTETRIGLEDLAIAVFGVGKPAGLVERGRALESIGQAPAVKRAAEIAPVLVLMTMVLMRCSCAPYMYL